jgi:hypothetical protein
LKGGDRGGPTDPHGIEDTSYNGCITNRFLG